MAQAFAEITFTPAVKAAQMRYGSRESYAALEAPEAPARNQLTAKERTFVEARDGFYQATVNADGWPYVQFRGGPVGFLKVLGDRTLAYADFAGNRQYLSVGNLQTNDRIALILMDYARRRRLKLWGRVRFVDVEDDPSLAASLAVEGYPARIERAVLIHVEAFDWNCPQHITPRFTEAEIGPALAELQAERDALRREVRRLRAAQPVDAVAPA